MCCRETTEKKAKAPKEKPLPDAVPGESSSFQTVLISLCQHSLLAADLCVMPARADIRVAPRKGTDGVRAGVAAQDSVCFQLLFVIILLFDSCHKAFPSALVFTASVDQLAASDLLPPFSVQFEPKMSLLEV